MTKQVQIRRGTDSQHTSFTGAEGEISVNTTNDSVHVHDGTTAGGKEMARADGSNVAFTSGTIDGTVIGGTTPAAGTFTTLTASGDVNFDSNTLFVDASANAVGIGTNAPDTPLEISVAGSGATNVLKLTTTGEGTVPSIVFEGDQGGTQHVAARIRAGQEDASNGNIIFEVEDAGSLDEAIRIMSDGSVGIGTSSPDTLLEIRGADPILTIRDTNTSSASSNATLRLAETGASDTLDAYWDIKADGGQLQFIDNWNEGGGTGTRVTIDDSGSVGIGTSPSAILHTKSSGQLLRLESTAATGSAYLSYYDSSALKGHVGYTGGSDDDFNIFNAENANIKLFTNSTERMRIDSSGRVGLGGSIASNPASGYDSRSNDFVVGGNGDTGITIAGGSTEDIRLVFTANGTSGLSKGSLTYDNANDSLAIETSGTGRMTVDGNGLVLIGTTDTSPYNNSAGSSADNGVVVSAGRIWAARYSGTPMDLNRTSDDGSLLDFRKNGSVIGSIGVVSGTPFFSNANNSTGIRIYSGGFAACNASGAFTDNTQDVGASSVRWDDVYATNGTIQTSDRNEKQQIASLTDAEITAAKAISKLFKTFKWNDSVEEKGDAARTHAGVIAQDVQQAMSNAGLDAGDYAFFISTTWWEAEIEVPAVEAVEAQDAVYDDDGNLVSEAVEAVEAQDAYTRTDTYDTAEEAPEGATERTRMGIRYPELLAFIGAATEQRLADIETRLTALETL